MHGGHAYERALSGLETSSTENMLTAGREGGVDLKEDPDAVVPRSSEDGRTADFISPFRNPGPSDTLQAVPTQYFYKESLTASLDPPTGETISRSQQDMPSAAGVHPERVWGSC